MSQDSKEPEQGNEPQKQGDKNVLESLASGSWGFLKAGAGTTWGLTKTGISVTSNAAGTVAKGAWTLSKDGAGFGLEAGKSLYNLGTDVTKKTINLTTSPLSIVQDASVAVEKLKVTSNRICGIFDPILDFRDRFNHRVPFLFSGACVLVAALAAYRMDPLKFQRVMQSSFVLGSGFLYIWPAYELANETPENCQQ